MPDDTPDDPQQIIADLQREVARYKAERDEALGKTDRDRRGAAGHQFLAGRSRACFRCDARKGDATVRSGIGNLWNTYDAGSVSYRSHYHGVPLGVWEKVLLDPANPGSPRPIAHESANARVRIHPSLIWQLLSFRLGATHRGRGLVELGERACFVIVGLRKDGRLLGFDCMTYHQETRPFTENQIALLQNFAAQAVIAVENARLITETREALEQQTATAQVLEIINSSPRELTPVFDTILEKAHNLCGAAKGALMTLDGEHFSAVATRGLSKTYTQMLREPRDNPPDSPRDRLLGSEPFVQIDDFSALDLPLPRAAAKLERARTVLFVPLRKDGVLLGYITVYRQVGTFSRRHRRAPGG